MKNNIKLKRGNFLFLDFGDKIDIFEIAKFILPGKHSYGFNNQMKTIGIIVSLFWLLKPGKEKGVWRLDSISRLFLLLLSFGTIAKNLMK